MLAAMASWLRRSDNEPFFWLGSCPIFVTELLLILHSIAFVVVAISFPADFSSWIFNHLAFHSADVMRSGKVWELVTYAFVPPINLWFGLNMLSLFWFGRELESHLGRKGFLILYFCLAVCPMLILSALSTILPALYFGSSILHFALFLAFASLFPDTEMFLTRLQAKWSALISLVLYSLIFLSQSDWQGMIILWVSSSIATFAVRSSFFSNFVEWLENRRERQEAANALRKRLRIQQEQQIQERTIDEILDKISQHGMHSLTRDERAALERARMHLLKKEKR